MNARGLALALALFFVGAAAQEPGAPAGAAVLAAVREDLEALRFEGALEKIGILLAGTDVPEETRIEALTLRAQAHVATGDLDGAEKDYGEILNARPDFAPDPRLTPKKALARFEKVRAATVGTARLTTDPADARVLVDGKDVVAKEGLVYLRVGEHTLRAERQGFDPLDVNLRITAGPNPPIDVRLLPNARAVILRTDPDAVEIKMDERPVGATARPSGFTSGPAELLLPDIPLGEHIFELTKPCYRTLRVRVSVAVDLTDRSPMKLDLVTMEASRSRLVLTGGPADADVLVDGARVGRLPADALDVCAGERRVELQLASRTVWADRVSIAEGEETSVRVDPRPNVVFVGAETWPEDLRALSGSASVLSKLALPTGAALDTSKAWETIDLPPGTDIAVAVLPPLSRGGDDRVVLYSAALARAYPVVGPMPDRHRPTWRRTVIGARLANSAIGGPARVVEVIQGGPAAAAGIAKGDRIAKIDGVAVDGAAAAIERIGAQPAGTAFPVEIVSSSGAPRTVSCTGTASPVLAGGDAAEIDAALLAAWATVDAATSREDAAAALANLALLTSSAGQRERAVEIWRRVRFGARSGVADGTVSYYLGRDLETLGREAEAREAFARAKESSATAITDDGPPVAPAAADHLVDLGVARP